MKNFHEKWELCDLEWKNFKIMKILSQISHSPSKKKKYRSCVPYKKQRQ